MEKCRCSLHTGSFGGLVPPKIVLEDARTKLTWPMPCMECGDAIPTPEDAASINRFKREGPQAICKLCLEIYRCFFCSCNGGNMWADLRRAYTKIGLGRLTEILSKEAADKLIKKVDEWMKEDHYEEVRK